MLSWLLFALLYPFFYSIGNVIDKFLLEKKVKNNYSYGIFVGFFYLASALIMWVVVGLPKMSLVIVAVGIFSGSVYGIAILNYFHMLTYAEVSRMIGISYLFPAFVAVFSRIFLGEELAFVQYGAILLAVAGTLFLGIEKRKQRWNITPAFWLMILNALLIGIVDVSDKYLLQQLSWWQTYIVISIPLSLVIILPSVKANVRKDMKQAAKSLAGILVSEGLGIMGSFSFLVAAAAAPVAIVSAMGTLQPLFVFILMLALSVFTPYVLKEIITRGVIGYKIIGTAGIIVAAIILST